MPNRCCYCLQGEYNGHRHYVISLSLPSDVDLSAHLHRFPLHGHKNIFGSCNHSCETHLLTSISMRYISTWCCRADERLGWGALLGTSWVSFAVIGFERLGDRIQGAAFLLLLPSALHIKRITFRSQPETSRFYSAAFHLITTEFEYLTENLLTLIFIASPGIIS
jgi:hypothetical protein